MKNRYTPEQRQFIIDNGKGNNDKTLAALFNSKFGTNYSLSLIISARYRYGARSGLKTRVPNSGQFKKGQVSHNKGLKQSDFLSPEAIKRSSATRFKPGQVPINHRPVGSTRISVDGYVEVKTAEHKKWELKHRVVWREINGPIDKSDLIIFLDGDKTNCEIENLAKISRSENARINQNHLRSKCPGITKVAVTLSKVIAKSGQLNSKKAKETK